MSATESSSGILGRVLGLVFGGVMLTTPLLGQVVVLSGLGAALHSLSIPKESVIDNESVIKADGFLAHGRDAKIEQAKSILKSAGPSKLDTCPGEKSQAGTQIPPLLPA